MLKLLIACDGSDHSKRAIQVAGGLAREGAIEAILLNVRAGPTYYGALPPIDEASIDAALQQHQDALLADALEGADAAGLHNARSVAATGYPAQEIVRVAAEEKVDQIVMGTRGRSSLGGLLLGSVAQRVVHLAKAPVLLVK